MKHAIFGFIPVVLVLIGCVKTEDNGWDVGLDRTPDPVYEPDAQTDADWQAEPDAAPDWDVPVDGDVPVDTDVFDGPLDPDSPVDTVDIDLAPDTPAEPDADSTPCVPLEGGTCNLISNCNCGTGQKCKLFIDSADSCNVLEQCEIFSGSLPPGSACDPTSDQCAVGSSCTTDSLTGSSNCYEWCTSDLDCDAGGSCTVGITISIPSCADISLSYRACEI